METPNEQSASILTKSLLYVAGATIGIAAKIATIRKERSITIADVIGETCIASASAFLVWAFCHYHLKNDNAAIILSVIAGRFGDNILIYAYKKTISIINKLSEK